MLVQSCCSAIIICLISWGHSCLNVTSVLHWPYVTSSRGEKKLSERIEIWLSWCFHFLLKCSNDDPIQMKQIEKVCHMHRLKTSFPVPDIINCSHKMFQVKQSNVSTLEWFICYKGWTNLWETVFEFYDYNI